MRVSVELGGGLDLLFNNQKNLEISFKDRKECTFGDIVIHMRDELLEERPELFVAGDTLRPGILALINEVDWELEGGLESVISDGDNIVIISTLHGG